MSKIDFEFIKAFLSRLKNSKNSNAPKIHLCCNYISKKKKLYRAK